MQIDPAHPELAITPASAALVPSSAKKVKGKKSKTVPTAPAVAEPSIQSSPPLSLPGYSIDDVTAHDRRPMPASSSRTCDWAKKKPDRRADHAGDRRPIWFHVRRRPRAISPSTAKPAPFPAAKHSAFASPRKSARGLVGVCYVLDEPTIGLHQRDNTRLIRTLKRLQAIGNTVIMVEHDEDCIRAADYLIDIGPGAGAWRKCNRRRACPRSFQSKRSTTIKYMTGEYADPCPAEPKADRSGEMSGA